jgi:hypothetical protein
MNARTDGALASGSTTVDPPRTSPTRTDLDTLLDLAPRGLAAAHLGRGHGFAQTVRAVPGETGIRLQVEGHSVRYAAIAALGLATLPTERQRELLDGETAADVAHQAAGEAAHGRDPGAAALAAWAVAEICGEADPTLLHGLDQHLAFATRVPTVAVAWALTAAVAAAPYADTGSLRHRALTLLREHVGPQGLYPHLTRTPQHPAANGLRGHVGSFADQIYPTQALARAATLTGDADLLALADLTADRLVALQGTAGQWWWHYDSRGGTVVERYPVYSVHQHAMAPMVLHELHEHGGSDHRDAVSAGLGWLRHHPETVEELISERFGLIWRKVARREPRKAARGLGAAVTALVPGSEIPGLDRVLPPRVVDHECRPYELGWLLYAWARPERRQR